jgi:hypothetical protein
MVACATAVNAVYVLVGGLPPINWAVVIPTALASGGSLYARGASVLAGPSAWRYLAHAAASCGRSTDSPASWRPSIQ